MKTQPSPIKHTIPVLYVCFGFGLCRCVWISCGNNTGHFLCSRQSVVLFVKRGNPLMQTPIDLQEKRGGQHLPACLGSSENLHEELVLLEKRMFALLHKHARITDYIWEQVEQVEEFEFICMTFNNILDSQRVYSHASSSGCI